MNKYTKKIYFASAFYSFNLIKKPFLSLTNKCTDVDHCQLKFRIDANLSQSLDNLDLNANYVENN